MLIVHNVLPGYGCATISLGFILPWSADEILSLKDAILWIKNESFRVEYEGIKLQSHSIFVECENMNSWKQLAFLLYM